MHDALSPTHQALVTRVCLETADDRSLKAVSSAAAELSAPLVDDMVQYRYRNGAIGYEALGVTVAKMVEHVRTEDTRLQKLCQEWENVQQQIANLSAEMLGDENFPVLFGLGKVKGKKSGEEGGAGVDKLFKDMMAELDMCLREVDDERKRANKERKEAKKEFLASLQERINMSDDEYVMT